jgi:nondiscriminating aspartyl-tRNA synthetase
MRRVLSIKTPTYIGKEVKVCGWVHTVRSHGKLIFVDLRDVGGILQLVSSHHNKTVHKLMQQLTEESVIEAVGEIRRRPKGTENPDIVTGEVEMAVKKLKILSKAPNMLPIPIAEKGSMKPSLEKRLDWRWLDLRKPQNRLIFQIWTTMEKAFRDYCIRNGFIQIHSPKLMSTPSESGAEVFEVQYFDRKAYLAQSPQFYKQMAMAAGFEKVFEIGPVFRANPSFTPRHDSEFTMYDVEFSYINSHYDVIQFEEKLIVAMLSAIKKKHNEEIKKYYGKELVIPRIPFPRITFEEAKEKLARLNVPSKENDLSPEEERKLCEIIKKEKNHEFVFVTEWPFEARPFYHMKLETNPKLTKSFDLLWNGLEITTGSQREHRYRILVKQAKEKGIKLKSIRYYLNFFKYGCPPHGGFGLGPTRMLLKILDLSNVGEVTFLYRGPKRLTP